MKIFIFGFLTCLIFVCLSAQEEDVVVLADGERVFGTIIEDTPLLVIVKKKDGEIFKFPQSIVVRKRYTDSTNWGSISQHMRNGAYVHVYNKLYKDMRALKNGGSFRQVKTMVYCLRQLGQDAQLVDLCHEVTRYERQDFIQVIDLFIALESKERFSQLEKLWLRKIKYSKYKLARKRCALALACMYVVNGQGDKVQAIRKLHELDKEVEQHEVLQLLDQMFVLTKTKRALSTKHKQLQLTHLFQYLKIQTMNMQGAYDKAALQALKVGIDPEVDNVKRIGFLLLAQNAVQHVSEDDAHTIAELITNLKKDLLSKE